MIKRQRKATFKPYNPGQISLFPPSLDELIPENHFVRVVRDVIDTIYLSAGEKHYYCSTEECKKAIFNKLNRKSKKKLEIVVDSALIESSFTEI